MAFDFLGTFNKSQFERFLAFARTQVPLIEARQLHLENEIARIGVVVFRIEQGIPQGYAGDPETSYLGKLLRAYEALGGNPLLDLRLRLRSDPVYLIRGDVLTEPQYTSGGEPIGGKGLEDGPTAVLMQRGKRWLDDTVQARFNRLERRIRRAMDYSDQLQEELAELTTLQAAAEIRGSLEFIAAQIQQYITDVNYDAIYDDQGEDEHGLLPYAPRASYDVPEASTNEDVNREAERIQKQGDRGIVMPGTGGGGS